MLICLYLHPKACAQGTELVKIEYTYLPGGEELTHFNRFKLALNVPIKLSEKGNYFVAGLEYRSIGIGLEDQVPFFKENAERYQMFGANIAYTFKIKNDWRFGIRFGMRAASNFENGGIENDDIRYKGSIVFLKDKKEGETLYPWRIILGIQYSTPGSLNFPLPIINYYQKFHPKWSFSLGTPKTNLKYNINKKNSIQAYALLDRFYANIQDNRVITLNTNEEKIGENISSLTLISGLQYEYSITEHLLLYVNTGYTLTNDLRLRDQERNKVYTINNANSLYARGGIKFKI